MSMLSFMYVALGGAVGSMARYGMTGMIARLLPGGGFPYGTFAVNILGGLLMGMWLAAMMTWFPTRGRDLHLLLAVGALGGFTTFSAFTVDTYLLFERGMVVEGIVYVAGSVLLSLGGFFAGMCLIKYMAQ